MSKLTSILRTKRILRTKIICF